jgi:putative transposase
MDASPEQFADHHRDRAHLTTRDNSGAESLRSTFKHEYYYRHVFATKSELVAAVDKWMHFYNNQRRHSVIGMLSPIAYEHSLNVAAQAA